MATIPQGGNDACLFVVVGRADPRPVVSVSADHPDLREIFASARLSERAKLNNTGVDMASVSFVEHLPTAVVAG